MKKFIFALCVLVTLTLFIGLASRQISSASIQINISTKQPAATELASSPNPNTPNTPLSGRIIGATIFSFAMFSGIIIAAREIKSKQKKTEIEFIHTNDHHSPLL